MQHLPQNSLFACGWAAELVIHQPNHFLPPAIGEETCQAYCVPVGVYQPVYVKQRPDV